jgi:hypothetical protein
MPCNQRRLATVNVGSRANASSDKIAERSVHCAGGDLLHHFLQGFGSLERKTANPWCRKKHGTSGAGCSDVEITSKSWLNESITNCQTDIHPLVEARELGSLQPPINEQECAEPI